MRWVWERLSCIIINSETSEAVFHRIEQLTSEALLEVANEMFAEDYLSTLIYR